MAKTSVVERNKKRIKVIKKYAEKRAQLKLIIKSAAANDEERWSAQQKLQMLPRDANPIRRRNRCSLTGRPRGVYRKFGLSRSMLRIHAMRGDVPGLLKSSW